MELSRRDRLYTQGILQKYSEPQILYKDGPREIFINRKHGFLILQRRVSFHAVGHEIILMCERPWKEFVTFFFFFSGSLFMLMRFSHYEAPHISQRTDSIPIFSSNSIAILSGQKSFVAKHCFKRIFNKE